MQYLNYRSCILLIEVKCVTKQLYSEALYSCRDALDYTSSRQMYENLLVSYNKRHIVMVLIKIVMQKF